LLVLLKRRLNKKKKKKKRIFKLKYSQFFLSFCNGQGSLGNDLKLEWKKQSSTLYALTSPLCKASYKVIAFDMVITGNVLGNPNRMELLLFLKVENFQKIAMTGIGSCLKFLRN
jgi:hypothetical protein